MCTACNLPHPLARQACRQSSPYEGRSQGPPNDAQRTRGTRGNTQGGGRFSGRKPLCCYGAHVCRQRKGHSDSLVGGGKRTGGGAITNQSICLQLLQHQRLGGVAGGGWNGAPHQSAAVEGGHTDAVKQSWTHTLDCSPQAYAQLTCIHPPGGAGRGLGRPSL